MNHAVMVKWLNRLVVLVLVLLSYVFFIFVFSDIFNLKVFTRTGNNLFGYGVSGLFAVMGAALILNIMLNLSRIADGVEQTVYHRNAEQHVATSQHKRWWLWLAGFLLSLVLIGGALLSGDRYTRMIKKRLMMATAAQVIQERSSQFNQIVSLPLTENDTAAVQAISDQLKLVRQIERHVDNIHLLLPARYHGEAVVVQLDQHSAIADPIATDATLNTSKTPSVDVNNMLFSSDMSQRQWLQRVFAGQETAPRYSYENDNYELFYPVKLHAGWVVFYFTDRHAYGKVSSY